MTIADIIYEHVKAMPTAMVREVLDFIEFLESKRTSEDKITLDLKEWESLQETLYVLQNPSLMKQIAHSTETFRQGTGYKV